MRKNKKSYLWTLYYIFYKNHFVPLNINNHRPTIYRMMVVLNYRTIEMVDNINNNISENYIKYIHKFIF